MEDKKNELPLVLSVLELAEVLHIGRCIRIPRSAVLEYLDAASGQRGR